MGVRRGIRSCLRGVWIVYGGTQLCRPLNSGTGDEIRYRASPSGPSTSGDDALEDTEDITSSANYQSFGATAVRLDSHLEGEFG